MLTKKVITQFLCGLVVLWLFPSCAFTQDWIKTGTGLGVAKVRIAVPEFKGSSQDPRNPELLKTFNDTLWNDLDNAGIFEMVSKSFYPLGQVGAPADSAGKFGRFGSAGGIRSAPCREGIRPGILRASAIHWPGANGVRGTREV